MTTERGLRHVALKARDMQATERFYVEVLGFRVPFRMEGMLFLETPGGNDMLTFEPTRGRLNPKGGGFDHFGLQVPKTEWRRLQARLKRKGIRITGRRGRAAVFIRDPSGYAIELYRD
jgi:catechol 2,3-dioxygenase-like lactoylglutathione lyase family enzyme